MYIREIRRITGGPNSLCREAYLKSMSGQKESCRLVRKALAEWSIKDEIDCESYKVADSERIFHLALKCLSYLSNHISSTKAQVLEEYNLEIDEIMDIGNGSETIRTMVDNACEECQENIKMSKSLYFKCPNDMIVGFQSITDHPDRAGNTEFPMKFGHIVAATFLRPFAGVSANQDIQDLAHSLALHACGMMPQYILPREHSVYDCDAFIHQPFMRVQEKIVNEILHEEQVEIVEFYRDECLS
ncbi:hypothetical protein RF11_06855 [Thelohanellus kitauei]|uniref:Uncharacterized protein n=1 Tax=Thelohanellus kitauei TaxID=669202 RepID=A0A0C2MTC7_THEKT|nr:hypothetical protein RF11_06855 [Thelohanellus kitauei]